MTKKHFIALADWIKEHKGYSHGFNQSTIDSLANFCQSQNANFKHDRWLDYINGSCGKNGGRINRAGTSPMATPNTMKGIKVK